jgi:hypothetical protein
MSRAVETRETTTRVHEETTTTTVRGNAIAVAESNLPLSRVELTTRVHEEMMTTTVGGNAVGGNAVAVAESNLPLTREQIRDRLRQKYVAVQEIKKKEYDEDPPYDCWSDEEEEALMKELGKFEYPHGGVFMYEHPIDLESGRNKSYIDAFPEMELRSLQGRWVCPLSNKAREWRRTNGVSADITAHCGGNCNTDYDSLQSLEKHLRTRGKEETMHQYTLEFMEEWAKQH